MQNFARKEMLGMFTSGMVDEKTARLLQGEIQNDLGDDSSDIIMTSSDEEDSEKEEEKPIAKPKSKNPSLSPKNKKQDKFGEPEQRLDETLKKPARIQVKKASS